MPRRGATSRSPRPCAASPSRRCCRCSTPARPRAGAACCANGSRVRCATRRTPLRVTPPSRRYARQVQRDARSPRLLARTADIERIAARIALRSARPRDLSGLRDTLARAPELHATLGQAVPPEGASPLLASVAANLAVDAQWLALLQRAIASEPSVQLRDGGVIAPGHDAELDELRSIDAHCGEYLLQMEARERERTGIAGLKVEYNRVHGFYIEVTHAHAAKVPDDYRRRQTLKNAERYITPELKAFEDKALSAQERALARERALFEALAGGARARDPGVAAVRDGHRDTRRARVLRRARRGARPRAALVHERDVPRHPRRPAPRGGTTGRSVHPERSRAPARPPAPRRHRSEHGRQVDLHAPGRGDRAARVLRMLRAGAGRDARTARRDLHAHRCGRRSCRRAIHVHGGDDGGRRDPQSRDGAEPRADRRDRTRHVHVRRPGARLGDRARSRRAQPLPRALRDALLRADRAARRNRGLREPALRRRRARRRHRVPARGGGRPRESQLRPAGGEARGRARRDGAAGANAISHASTSSTRARRRRATCSHRLPPTKARPRASHGKRRARRTRRLRRRSQHSIPMR